MTFNNVSVLVPTRGRVARLETMIASFEQTISNGNAELVFRIDEDDTETIQFLLQFTYGLVVGPRGRGYADLPLFFNGMVKAAHGDVLMVGNDDMIFQTEDWASMILEVANQYPDGLFDLGVSTLNMENFPFATVSRKAVDRLGFMWDPRIFWGDIFWRDVMAYFGRCLLLPTVQIDHDWAGFKPDKVYMEALAPGESAKDIQRRDPNYWTVTHRVAVDEAVDKLRGLLA